MLSSSGKSEYPCSVPEFPGKASRFSPLGVMLVVGFSWLSSMMIAPLLKHSSVISYNMKEVKLPGLKGQFFYSIFSEAAIE